MANVGDLVVNIKADGSNLNRELDKTESRMKGMSQSMGRVGRRMSLAVTAPIAGFAASSIMVAASFEKEMNKVRALTGSTGDEFKALENQALELGKTTMFSARQSADAMGFLAMAGFEANEVMGAMPSVLNLAAAGQMDLATTADITSNILTGYRMDVEQLSHANDVLVTAMTSANVDLTMLGESMKYVAPIASSAGFQFEEMTAAVALLGNAGIQGSMAGTSLRFAIGSLLDPSDEATATLRKLGIQTHDTEGNLLGMVDIVRQLENSGADTASMLSIFGQRAGSGMAALVSQGADALEGLITKLEESGGTAERVAEVQMSGMAGSMLEFKSALENLQITIGVELNPILTELLDEHITPLVKGFADLDEGTKKTIIMFGLVAAAIAPVLMMLGMMMPALAFLFANPVGLAILAIALAIATVLVWMNKWEENIDALTELWNIFDYRMRQIFGIDTWNDFKKAVSGNIGMMIDGVQGLWDVFKGIWDLLNGDWDAAGEHFKAAAKHFEDAFQHALDMIGGLIGLIKDAFLGLMDELGAFIFGREFWETIKENFMSQKDKVVDYFSEFVDKMGRLWGGLWGALMDVFSGNIEGAIQHLKDATDVLIESLNEAIDGFNKLNPFKNVPKIKTFAEKDAERNRANGQLGMEDTFGARGIGSQMAHQMDLKKFHGDDFFAPKASWARNAGRPAPDGVNVTVNMLGNSYGMDDLDDHIGQSVMEGVRRGGFQGVIPQGETFRS